MAVGELIERLRGALKECHSLSVARWRRLLAAEAENERLREALREAQPFIGWTGSYPELHAKIDALLRE